MSLPSSDHPEEYEPSARPGSRAPHAWLAEDRSTLDLFGHGFVLLRIGPDAPDVSTFEAAAAAAGDLPLTTVAVARQEVHDLYERRLVLVRPDGHVAWRADELPLNLSSIVDSVRGAVQLR